MTTHDLIARRREDLERVGADLRAARRSAPRLGAAAAVSVESDPPGVIVSIDADGPLSLLVRPDWRSAVTEGELPGLVVATVREAQTAHANSRLESTAATSSDSEPAYAPSAPPATLPTRADLEQAVRRGGPLALVRMVQAALPAAPVEQAVTSAAGHVEATHLGNVLTGVEIDPGWLRVVGAAELTAELGEVASPTATTGGAPWT